MYKVSLKEKKKEGFFLFIKVCSVPLFQEQDHPKSHLKCFLLQVKTIAVYSETFRQSNLATTIYLIPVLFNHIVALLCLDALFMITVILLLVLCYFILAFYHNANRRKLEIKQLPIRIEPTLHRKEACLS